MTLEPVLRRIENTGFGFNATALSLLSSFLFLQSCSSKTKLSSNFQVKNKIEAAITTNPPQLTGTSATVHPGDMLTCAGNGEVASSKLKPVFLFFTSRGQSSIAKAIVEGSVGQTSATYQLMTSSSDERTGLQPEHAREVDEVGDKFSCQVKYVYPNGKEFTSTLSSSISIREKVSTGTATATASPTTSASVDTTPPSSSDIVPTGTPGSNSTSSSLNVNIGGVDVVEYKRVFKSDGSACAASDFDGESWKSVATPITDSVGADGNKRLCVIVKDSAGNATPTSAPMEYSWIKDTTEPTSANITLSGTPVDPSNGTNLNVTVSGTEITSYQYALTTNSTACTAATFNGTWIAISTSMTATIGADANKKRLCVIAKDAAGNAMDGATDAAKSYDWKQETVTPVSTDITLTGTPSDPSNGANLNVTVGGTDVATYQYALTTNSTACTAATYNGSWIAVATNITASIGSDADKKRLCVIAKDAAGNAMVGASDTAKSYDWKQDATAPTATDITLTGAPSDPSNSTANLDITVSGTDVSAYKYAYTTNSTACTAATYSGSWIAVATHITDAVGADANKKRLCVIAQDALGNSMSAASTAKSYDWKQDTTKPASTDITLSGTPADPSNGTSLNVAVGGTDVATYQYALTTNSTVCTAATYNGTWIAVATNITATIGADADKKRLCVIAQDAAGNAMVGASDTAKSYDWKQDTTAPVSTDITLTGTPADPSNGTGNLDVTVGGTDITHYKYSYTTSATACTAATYSASWIAVATHITDAIGSEADKKRLCVIARDTTGNGMTSSDTAKSADWKQDTTAPTTAEITLSGHPTGSSGTVSLDITVSGTGVSSYRYKLATSDTCSTDSGYSSSVVVATHITDSIASNATYPNNGSIYLCVKGVDAAGNITAAADAKKVNWTKNAHFISSLSPALWLKADSGVTKDGSDKVSGWTDNALSNSATQATAANQPTWIVSAVNGQPTIRFDGSNDFIAVADHASLDLTSSMHFFMVYQLASAANTIVMEKGSNTALMLQPAGSTGEMFYYSTSGGYKTVGTYHGADFKIIEMTYDGATKSFYVNGTLKDSGTVAAVSANSSSLVFGATSAGDYAADIDISEAILFSSDLSIASRHKVLGYLAAKYDINVLQTSNQSNWLRADKDLYTDTSCTTPTSTNGASIACWKDQSAATANVTQSTAGRRPTLSTSGLNSLPNLSFDGVDDIITSGVSSNSTNVFVVGRRNAASAHAGSLMMYNETGTSVAAQMGSNISKTNIATTSQGTTTNFNDSTATFINGVGHLLSSISGSSRFEGFLNGLSLGSALPLVRNNLTNQWVGAYSTGSNNWDGDISEIIKYTSELTAYDRNRVESYLGQKYNVTQASNSVLDAQGLKLWLKADAGVTTADGNAAQFTAANSESLNIADNAALSVGDQDFSIATWVYLDSKGSNNKAIVGKWSGASYDYALMYFQGLDKFSFHSSTGYVTSSATVSTGQWYFLVAIHDSVNNTLGISVNNGTLETVAYSNGFDDTTNSFCLGCFDSGYNLDGRMAKTGFWKRALTAAERTQLYNVGKGLSYIGLDSVLKTSLQAYWNLSEASGTRNDSHGTNHLTDNNTVTQTTGTGSMVSAWADQSGFGFDGSQSTAGSRPAWVADGGTAFGNKPVIVFNGSNSIATSSISSSLKSIIAVMAYDTAGPAANYYPLRQTGGGTGYLGFISHSGVNFQFRYDNGSAQKVMYYGTYATLSTSPYILSGVKNGSNVYLFKNGVQVDDDTYQTVTQSGAVNIGANFVGRFAEIIGIANDVSSTSREAIECYLSSKYSITVSQTCP